MFIMHPIAILPLLCAVVALTLSLLCVFAGSKPGYLENVDLLKVSSCLVAVISTDE